MRKLLTILFCLCVLSSLAQPKRYKGAVQANVEGRGEKSLLVDSAIGLPRYADKLDTSVIKYQGRKGDALMFADTLHGYIYWYNPHTGLVDTVNKAGGTGSSIINTAGGSAIIDTVLATGYDTIISVYTGTAIVSGVQTMTLNGSGIQYFKQPIGSNYTYIYYGDAPEGEIVYKISLVGSVTNSTDSSIASGGGGTDTTGSTGGGTANSLNSAWTYTVDTSCQVNFGASFALGSSSSNMVALANTGLSYARVPYNGSGTPSYPSYSAYNVLLGYNPAPPVAGSYFALPTDTAVYRSTLNTFLNTYGTTNVKGLANINEPGNIKHGDGYWNPGSAKNMIALLRTGANVAHEHGLKAYDGGIFSGEIGYYEVWRDFINNGHPDSAAAFAAAVFPAGTNLNKWASDTAHGYRIIYLDSLIAALPTLPLDGVNIHLGLTYLDTDSTATTLNTLPFKQMVRYLHRVSGKPVISNELSFSNNSNADILSQLIDAIEELHDAKNGDMSMAFVLNIANHAFANADGSLTAFGQSFKNKLSDTHIDIAPLP